MQRLAALLRERGPAVVLTGAGISVPSGIPDFRSPASGAVTGPQGGAGGIWANVDPMEVAHIDAWRRDPVRFWSFYGTRFDLLDGKRPNGAHRALAELQRRGLVRAVITQNIDGLHAAAGTPDPIELHGSVRTSVCLRDGAEVSLAEVRARIASDPDGVPRCDCGAPLKPGVVLFGELLPEAAIERAQGLCADAGLLIAIGSSLVVWPAAGLPDATLRAGGALAIVTRSATPYDDDAVVRLGGDVEAELSALLDCATG